jgi:hypothetical protein
MQRFPKIITLILTLILAGLACKSQAAPAETQTPQESPAPLTLDCIANSPDCPQIIINGETPAVLPTGTESPFRGYADPSIRRDPATGYLWMAYSAPNLYAINSSRPVPGVEIHLASSKDSGKTWEYQGVLWSVQPSNNPTNNDAGYINHEVANLLPVQTESGIIWYGIRLDYFLPEQGAFKERPFNSFHLVIAQANSPIELANAETVKLSTHQTAPEWNADLNLAALSPNLARCGMWNEPALHFQNGELVLALRCLVFGTNGVPKVEQSDLVVFATKPARNIHELEWRYVGVLAGGKEAQELGGSGLTQVDFALGIDGQLLAILSPDSWSDTEKDFVHFGCQVVEVESLAPPAFERDSNGNLRIRATITASDLPAFGPAACAYDPVSKTGIIIGRRIKQTGFMEVLLHSTRINP